MSDLSTLPPPAQEIAEQRTPLPPVRLTLPTFPEPPARPRTRGAILFGFAAMAVRSVWVAKVHWQRGYSVLERPESHMSDR